MKTQTITRIPSWLPGFPGFYNTVFDADLHEEVTPLIESGDLPEDANVDDVLAGWQNGLYEANVVKCICDLLPGYFPRESGILKCDFERVISPKEYNFTNDSANVTFEIDMEMFAPWLRDYLTKHADQWQRCLSSHYRSRDGFMSYYPHDAAEWQPFIDAMLADTEPPVSGSWYNGAIPEDHLLGRILEFVLDTEHESGEPAYINMYYDVFERIYVSEFIDVEQARQHYDNRNETQ